MKHAAPADQTPAPTSSPETTARRRFSAPKIIGIVAGSIVGLLLIAYVAGGLYFTDRFMPNTVLGDHDVSLKTSSEVQAVLDDALSDYTVAVSGQGFSMKLSAKDAGVSFDGQAIVADALGNTNPWLWPLEITREHDETDSLAASSGSGLANAVRTAVDEFNATATPPTDAVVAFDEQKNAFAVRPEATGFGAVYFVRQMLAHAGDTLEGKRIAISGFGNVAWGVALKATELGARVVTISGPDGYVYDPEGLDAAKIDCMLELRASNNDVVSPYAERFPGAEFHAGARPWEVPVDIAMPCATQNELDGEDADRLIANGVRCVAEVSNMGCTPEAIDRLIGRRMLYAPGKAVNAGGVATSGLEMSQNAMKMNWGREEVDRRLHEIMSSIHHACLEFGTEPDGYVNYMKGANIAGFMKVARSMAEQGIV